MYFLHASAFADLLPAEFTQRPPERTEGALALAGEAGDEGMKAGAYARSGSHRGWRSVAFCVRHSPFFFARSALLFFFAQNPPG